MRAVGLRYHVCMHAEETYRVVPAQWRVLSGSALKLIATVLMLIDHVNHHLLAQLPVFCQTLWVMGDLNITPVYLLSTLGRSAFPLYCFLLVEGFSHTHDVKRYVRNLFMFALVSEVPWDLEHGGTWFILGDSNVFFTLGLGLLAMIAIRHWRGSDRGPLVTLQMGAAVAVLIWLSEMLGVDYGARGIELVISLYLLKNWHLLRAVAGCAILRSHLRASPAYVLMELYNGERGFVQGQLLKYAFYAFYPAHILVIALIKMHLGYV